MKHLKVHGKVSRDFLNEIFSENVGKIDFSRQYDAGNVTSITIAGQKYFFRTKDYIGFIMSSFYDGSVSMVSFGRIGGGSGLFNITWGAGNKVEDKVVEQLRNRVISDGFTCDVLEDGN
ncbi:MAG: hypothetical protein M1414_05745 [Candidatus Thermoplasmatota archaeon]|jgi:hypothetical protein|nr:hypothetical protein [Candidatus Thermoplasmatota archaeon]MCL5988385.1 hypothetical protein [Candidatus Thermoplasmatota archaeon]